MTSTPDRRLDPRAGAPLRRRASPLGSRWAALAMLLLVPAILGALPRSARADDSLNIEDSLAQFVILANEQHDVDKYGRAGSSQPPRPGEPEAPAELKSSQNIAVLPQLGYDPEVGFIFGGKFSDINFGASHMNLDIGATQSTGGETQADVTWGMPHLFGTQFIGLVRAQFQMRPVQDFYGLGNNDVGGSPISQHGRRRMSLTVTLARHLAPHWLLAGTLGLNHVHINIGDPQHGKPSTPEAFPDLPGIHGGYTNPVSLSLVYNTQRDLTRPQNGWSVAGRVQHVGPELGNHYRFTRFIMDARYTHTLGSRRNVIGLRLDGEYVLGHGDHLPFYEFASLGGYYNLQGYKPGRFLGQSRVFARIGYQRLLADFDFRHLWRVRLDASLFAGVGRVFLDRSRLPDALASELSRVSPGRSDKLRYSYGAGLHVALGEALATRLDVGFSPESHGLVYLSFGNAF